MREIKVMTIRISKVFFAAAFFFGAAFASAQASSGRIDFALTYSATEANIVGSGNHFWLNGGTAELAAKAYGGLGIVANITGSHQANTGLGVPLNLLTTTFGPRYTWMSPKHTFTIFGQGLIGEAHGFRGLFPDPGGPNTDALSFASQVGGGVDIGISRYVSLRVIQADWLRTQLPNSTTNVQNDLHLGAGIVFHTAN